MRKTLFLLMNFSLIACSTVRVSSQDTSISLNKDKKQEVSLTIQKEFFLWGLIPTEHNIDVKKSLDEKGYSKIESFSVLRERRAGDVIWSILSLGVYTPQTFILNAKVE